MLLPDEPLTTTELEVMAAIRSQDPTVAAELDRILSARRMRRFYLACHEARELCVVRHKDAPGLMQWKYRHWRVFPSSPRIVEATLGVLLLVREAWRRWDHCLLGYGPGLFRVAVTGMPDSVRLSVVDRQTQPRHWLRDLDDMPEWEPPPVDTDGLTSSQRFWLARKVRRQLMQSANER